MEVTVEASVVKANAARPGRSRSKRFNISDEKCWASPAEPPLPQVSTLPLFMIAAGMAAAAAAISAGSSSRQRCLTAMLSSKVDLMRSIGSTVRLFLK